MLETGKSICVLPKLEGLGGPASFLARFSTAVRGRGIEIHHDPDAQDCAAILVISGTRHLDKLWKARRRGVRIVQRLDGMNWIHRKRRTGLRHYLRSEKNNQIMATVRRHLADAIVYQSRYVEENWGKVFGQVNAVSHQIYNGVDLEEFSPFGDEKPSDRIRLLVVEGRFRGGHEVGLRNAVCVAEALDKRTQQPVEMMVVAEIDPAEQNYWERTAKIPIIWRGVVPREQIAIIDRSAHLYFSAEINAPCPNSVIEALASGTPVISFDTGSLQELVVGDAGRLVEYGDNFEKLGLPDCVSLADSAMDILNDPERFQNAARERALTAFDIRKVVEEYLEVLLD
jgi:glycosyltransferase involved in cell wall biosynthesis